MRRTYLIGVAMLIVVFRMSGQFIVSGIVVDENSQQPIDQVTIQAASDQLGTVSDANGYFTLNLGERQEELLTFSHLSFETYKLRVSRNGKHRNLTIQLLPAVETLSEVEVMGVNTEGKPYRTEEVRIPMLQKSNLQDAGDFLRSIPNVSGVRKGATGIDPVVRGFKYSQLNVQLNGGTRIEGGCPNRMDPATAHVDLNDIRQIQILKGPYALKYGVNFAGVIDLTTYQPEFYKKYKTNVNTLLGGQTNHTGWKTKVAVNGANDIVTYNITGSWKSYDDYKDGNEEWVPASLQQSSISGNLGFKIAQKHVVYASADLSNARDIDFPTLPMDERKDETRIFSFNYIGNSIGKSINFIRFKAYSSDVSHEMDNKSRPFSDTVVAISNINARNYGGKFGVNFKLGKAVVEAGADLEVIQKDGQRVKYLIMQPMLPRKLEDLWNDARISNLGFFAEYHRPGKVIDWIAAARLDFNSASSGPLVRTNMAGDAIYQNDSTESQYTNVSFSGGLTWHISRSSDLLFALGRGVRSPDVTERFIILLPIGYDPYDYLGNPELKPEINNQIDLGYRFRHSKIGQFEFSGFFSLVEHFILGELLPPTVIKPQTKGVLGVKEFTNVDQVYMTGFEFVYHTPANYDWEVLFNASYTRGWNPEAVVYIYEDGSVTDREIVSNDPLPEIPPFEFFIAFNYKLFNSAFEPGISTRIVAQQQNVSEAFNEQSTPGFVLVNLDLKYQFNKNLKIYAGIKNLLNTAYYEHLNRNIIGTQYPLFEPGRIFYANLIFNL